MRAMVGDIIEKDGVNHIVTGFIGAIVKTEPLREYISRAFYLRQAGEYRTIADILDELEADWMEKYQERIKVGH